MQLPVTTVARLIAAAWFGALALTLTGALYGRVAIRAGAIPILSYLVLPTACAVAVGAVHGYLILVATPERPRWRSAVIGACISLESLLLFAPLFAALDLSTGTERGFLGLIALIVGAGGVVLGPLLALLGAIAGLLLHVVSQSFRRTGPTL